ncbi:MAG: choice-of-anchor B family protein, partial [Planctomycetota bacterium]
SQPVFVGAWSSRYVHDAQVVTYTSGALAGREIAYCCTGLSGGFASPGLTVLDVTNKANITVLSQLTYPDAAYSHQGWLSEDRTRFYLGDELDEGGSMLSTTTHVFDVQDPSNVTYSGAFSNGDPAVGHNMYTHSGLLFQANYSSGLRVFDVAGDPDQPEEVAYFDTAPMSTATDFSGLWSCYPYFPSGTVIGSDRQRGLFVWSLDISPISLDIVGEVPELLPPSGATVDLTIAPALGATLDLTSPALTFDLGQGPIEVPLVAQGGDLYTAAFPTLPCGETVSWYVSASTVAGEVTTAPLNAPGATFRSIVATSAATILENDMEEAAGWIGGAPGDTATAGAWVRRAPIGTAAQPGQDHSPNGTQCWFTGQGIVGGSQNLADVDGGFTTLQAAPLDLTGLTDPLLSYYRWYSNSEGNAPFSDVFTVEISGDDGATWTLVESVGPTGPEVSGGWFLHSFRVRDFIVPSSTVRLRFIASDVPPASIVEAAIDDFAVRDLACDDGVGSIYCEGNPNSTGAVSTIVAAGSSEVLANDLVLTAVDLPPNSNGYFVVSMDQAFVPNVGGGQGNLCLGGSPGRYLSQLGNSGAAGELSLTVENGAIPQPNGTATVMPGDTWNFQCWHRDANPGATSNFSRGYAVLFQ